MTGLLAATFQAAYFSSVSLTSVSLATLVTIGATPVIVLVAELLLGRRRLDRSGVTRTALALAGLGLLVGLPAAATARPPCLRAPRWRCSRRRASRRSP